MFSRFHEIVTLANEIDINVEVRSVESRVIIERNVLGYKGSGSESEEETEGAFAFSRLVHNFYRGGETQWEQHRMQEFTSPSRINGEGAVEEERQNRLILLLEYLLKLLQREALRLKIE